MHIKKLYATFGKLSNETLTLSHGLNVIYGRNESGKSTWSAFIRAMFYGVATREQKRNGFLPDKERYLPHNGSPMYGRMELSEKCGEMTIERTSAKSGVLSNVVSRYDETGLDAPEGETLVGVSKSVYERTAFIRQSGLSVSRDDDTERRILSIVSSGDETISATEVTARLKKRQRLLRSVAKNGEIPKLEDEIIARRKKITEARVRQEELSGISEKLSEIRKKESALAHVCGIAKTSGSLSAGREYPTRRELDLFIKKKNEWAMAGLRAEKSGKLSEILREEIARSEEVLFASPLSGKDESEARTLLSKALLTAERARKRKKLIPVAIAFCVIGAICIALAVFFGRMFFVPAIAFFVAGATCIVFGKKSDSFLIEKYGTDSEEKIRKLFDDYTENLSRAENLSQKLILQEDEAAAATADARSASDELKEIAKRFLSETADFDEAERALVALLAAGEEARTEDETQLKELTEEKQNLEISLAARRGAGDDFSVDSAEAELCRLEAELLRAEREYSALSLAIDTITESAAELKKRFSPGIEKRTSEIFKVLSGGNYEIVRIKNNEFEMNVAEGIAGMPYEHLTLSQGTLDELYLALRIALFEAVVPQENPPPLVLDDAMVNFDDERMKRALDLLYEKSKSCQIIIFSCHEREAEYLRKKTDVNIIKL